MNTIATRMAGIALVSALAACSSNPKSPEQALAEQPVRSAPFELVTTDRGEVLTLQDVLFDFEASSLRPEAQGVIAQAASYLKDNPSRLAVVEGHTDHTGASNYNVYLSEERSQTVRDALVAAGISPERITTEGFGEAKPVASNATRDGRQQNRRVEILFTQERERNISHL